MNWLQTLTTLDTPAVLISVAQVAGSCPREAGARMLVTAFAQFDTIGGGHLQRQACAPDTLACNGSARSACPASKASNRQ